MEKIYSYKVPLPKKNKFILGLLFFKFPLLLPPVTYLIKRHLKHCKNVHFLPGFFYLYGKIYAENVGFSDAFIMDYAPVHIGKFTSFAPRCVLLTGYHDYKEPLIVRAKPITIGNNVIVYTGVTIIGGVHIGDNSIIGAGSVVAKNIPANCFAAGNPAKVIRYLK